MTLVGSVRAGRRKNFLGCLGSPETLWNAPSLSIFNLKITRLNTWGNKMLITNIITKEWCLSRAKVSISTLPVELKRKLMIKFIKK